MSTSVYLYGLLRAGREPGDRLGTGVGDPPTDVRLIRHQRIAGAISEVNAESAPGTQVRGLRRDMTAHATVLERLSGFTAVLPARFGICLPGRSVLVEEVLRAQYRAIDEQLERVADAVELAVRITYREHEILNELYEQRPVLAGGRGALGRSRYDDRIERGREIAAALRAKRDEEAEALLHQLSSLARDVSVSEPPSDMTVLKASLLVDRQNVPRVDAALEKLYGERKHRMEFDYMGPLPPYSFVSLRLPAGEARWG